MNGLLDCTRISGELSPYSLTQKGTYASGLIETFTETGEVAVSVRSLDRVEVHRRGTPDLQVP